MPISPNSIIVQKPLPVPVGSQNQFILIMSNLFTALLQNSHDLSFRKEYDILILLVSWSPARIVTGLATGLIMCHAIDFVQTCSFTAILLMCNSLKLCFLPEESFCINTLMLLEETFALIIS